MKLYEINEELRALLDRAEEEMNEAGEVRMETCAALNHLNEARLEKIEGTALFIREQEAEAKMIKEEADRLAAKARAKSNSAKWLREWLQAQLHGEKVKTGRVSCYEQRHQVLYIEEGANVPEAYVVHEVKYKRDELKKAIRAGETFEGVGLDEHRTLVIR